MAQLDRERIAATALAVLDERGYSGFTIRAVAAALDVTPMALYHHVANKSELAALVVSLANTERPIDAPTGVWQDDLWAIARWTRESTRAHPEVGELRRVYRIYTPDMVLIAERWMNIWLQSGLSPENAAIAARVSGMTVGGLVIEEEILRNVDLPDEALLDPVPHARVMFRKVQDPVSAFELAIRSLIDGLYERLKDTRRG